MSKIVCIIPARGGSKGLPGKNIDSFAGKPLIAHSIDFAVSEILVDKVYVSTDDNNIAQVSQEYGAEIIERPDNISGDNATTEETIDHFLHVLKQRHDSPDIIILLQATSPYRPKYSLHEALSHFMKSNFDSLLTISPTHRFFWKTDGGKAIAEYDFINRPMRQNMKPGDIRYVENGSFYIFTRQHFEQTQNRLGGKIGYHILPEKYSMEIDSELDLTILEQLFLENSI